MVVLRRPLLLAVAAGAAAAAAPFPRATPYPNLVFILVDDLGESGVAFNNPTIVATNGAKPGVTALREAGLLLTRHYVYKYCSPTRGSILTGRYPYRLGSMRSNFIPWSRPDGLRTGFELLPQRLKALPPLTGGGMADAAAGVAAAGVAAAGGTFATHHVGKWHLGFHNRSFLPTSRGFDTFFGYLSGMQDHFTEQLSAFIECKHIVDLTEQDQPAYGLNGTYTGWMYNQRAVQVIEDAAAQRRRWLHSLASGAMALSPPKPFFLNYWMQNTHAPVEVPAPYAARYNFTTQQGAPQLDTFYGMVSVVDEAVANITAALKAGDLWDSTLVVYTHDNGAPLGDGGSNFPLRGGKNSNFEGGVRVPAIVSGGALPAARRNATLGTLFHAADWTPTLLGALGGFSMLPDALSAEIPVDGIDQWAHLVATPSASHAPRTEVVLDHCMMGASGSTGCNHFASKRAGGVGALIGGADGDMKLVAGPNGGSWTSWTNGTKCNKFAPVACADHDCLFNLSADAGEHHDLSADPAHAPVLAALQARFAELATSYHPPEFNPPAEDAAVCAAAAAAGGFLTPWTSPPQPAPTPTLPPAPPPAPVVPLGPCVGAPGSTGNEVYNGTGGAGPGYRHVGAAGLGAADVAACRATCCADAFCVSFVLHRETAGNERTYGCWLNAANGTAAPYARPDTLLAYVNRTAAAAQDD